MSAGAAGPEVPLPEQGQVWAARGEYRPRWWRTVLVVVGGHDGGALYFREGFEQHSWMPVPIWCEWVRDSDATVIDATNAFDPTAEKVIGDGT